MNPTTYFYLGIGVGVLIMVVIALGVMALIIGVDRYVEDDNNPAAH